MSGGVTAEGDTLVFDGTDAWARVDGPSDGSHFTFAADVTFDSAGFYQRVFDFGDGRADDNILLARHGTTDAVQLYICSGGSIVYNKVIDGQIENGVEAHWAVSLDDSDGGTDSVILYKDGAVVDSFTGQGILDAVADGPRGNSLIGTSNWSNDADFHGSIGDILISDEALNAAQIQDHMNDMLVA